MTVAFPNHTHTHRDIALPRFLRRQTDTPEPRHVTSIVPEIAPLTTARLVLCVLLPFAAGYFLSYVFRSINAVIAGPLVAEFDLGPAGLGFMTSAYFLACIGVQLPVGTAMDRYGPKRIQAALMLVAAIGSLQRASGPLECALVHTDPSRCRREVARRYTPENRLTS